MTGGFGSDQEWGSVEELNRLSDPLHVSEDRGNYRSKEESPYDGYRGLRVWQVSMDHVAETYRLTGYLPDSERYGLFAQIRRAAVSVPLNISEGWGRNGKAELARFCDIARGSLHEVDAAIEVCVLLKYLGRDQIIEANTQFKRLGAMLFRLTEALRQR